MVVPCEIGFPSIGLSGTDQLCVSVWKIAGRVLTSLVSPHSTAEHLGTGPRLGHGRRRRTGGGGNEPADRSTTKSPRRAEQGRWRALNNLDAETRRTRAFGSRPCQVGPTGVATAVLRIVVETAVLWWESTPKRGHPIPNHPEKEEENGRRRAAATQLAASSPFGCKSKEFHG